MSDPLVISALENGEPKLMAGQAEALLDKLDRLLRLRRLPAADKHLALMFWNHPEGEKNVAASHLNVPASLARLGEALRAAGYRVATSDESALIDTAQRLLGGYYRPQTLDALYRDGLAASLPLDATCTGSRRCRRICARRCARAGATRVDIGPCAISTASDASCSRRRAWVICCCCRSRRAPAVRARPTTTARCRRTISSWRSTSSSARVSAPTR